MKYGFDRSVRLYFSICDISQITGLDSDSLVNWEEVFPIKPTRNRAAKRVYRQVDLHKIQWIQIRLSQSVSDKEINSELSSFSPTELKQVLAEAQEQNSHIKEDAHYREEYQQIRDNLVEVQSLLERARLIK